jgi:hypothetical protein
MARVLREGADERVVSKVVELALAGLLPPQPPETPLQRYHRRVRALWDDYADLELRTLAHMGALEKGTDIHNQLAELIFQDAATSDAEFKARRQAAQSIGFTLLYGNGHT